MGRYVIGKDYNTKDWFVYDNETNVNICWCDSEEEAEEYIAKIEGYKERNEEMKKYSICTIKGDDGFETKYFNTLEEARMAAKERAKNERFTMQEINKYKPHVLISLEEVDEEGELIDYIDSIESVEITEPF